MIGLRWTPTRALRAILLALIGFAGIALALPPLGRIWGRWFVWLLDRLGYSSAIEWNVIAIGDLYRLAVPYPLLDGPWPDTPHWIIVGAATVALIVISLLLPRQWMPARYFLRFVAAIQTVSLAWFAFSAPPFPYPLPGYIGGLLTAGMAVLTLVPIAFGFGFYIFDHTLWRQILLTALVTAHLAILLPLQGLVHAALIHHFSLAVQPTLFFVFGLLVEILVLVSFYGWAMSWTGTEIPRSPAAGAAP